MKISTGTKFFAIFMGIVSSVAAMAGGFACVCKWAEAGTNQQRQLLADCIGAISSTGLGCNQFTISYGQGSPRSWAYRMTCTNQNNQTVNHSPPLFSGQIDWAPAGTAPLYKSGCEVKSVPWTTFAAEGETVGNFNE